jgi:hypothetical protein
VGYEPRDVSDQKVGYDIKSKVPETVKLRFLEVNYHWRELWQQGYEPNKRTD